MPQDNWNLDRFRNALSQRSVRWEEKKMFGGVCFMVDDKMLFGISDRGFMVRVNPDDYERMNAERGVTPMIHGGKPMKGFLYVPEEGYDMDRDFDYWVDECLAYNPQAKSSKK